MNDPVAAFLTLAEIPAENLSEIETFLGTQKTDSATLAVLERPDQPVALLKIDQGEATLFSVLPSERGSRLLHETYIGKVRDATVTQVHAIENLGDDASALHPERVEITGSRLMGQINLEHYNSEERAALIDALRMITDPRS